jgi:hypothetical protein
VGSAKKPHHGKSGWIPTTLLSVLGIHSNGASRKIINKTKAFRHSKLFNRAKQQNGPAVIPVRALLESRVHISIFGWNDTRRASVIRARSTITFSSPTNPTAVHGLHKDEAVPSCHSCFSNQSSDRLRDTFL